MHVVIVTFTPVGLDHEAYAGAAEGIAPAFADIPGLVAKLWPADPETGLHGGVYVFETAEAARAYLASELCAQALLENPAFRDVAVRDGALLDTATAITTPGLDLAVA